MLKSFWVPSTTLQPAVNPSGDCGEAMPKDDEKDPKDEPGPQLAKRGIPDINGQIDADLEFTQRAEELLAKLRSRKEPPAAEPEPSGEKPTGITDKHE